MKKQKRIRGPLRGGISLNHSIYKLRRVKNVNAFAENGCLCRWSKKNLSGFFFFFCIYRKEWALSVGNIWGFCLIWVKKRNFSMPLSQYPCKVLGVIEIQTGSNQRPRKIFLKKFCFKHDNWRRIRFSGVDFVCNSDEWKLRAEFTAYDSNCI